MITEHFVTPIYQKVLDLDCSEIEKQCLEYRNQNDGVQATNVGGWQSHNINSETNAMQFIDDLKKGIFQGMKEIKLKYQLNIKSLEFGNMWININGPNDYNKQHIHTNSFFSGVYYVTVPKNSGDLAFFPPSLLRNYVHVIPDDSKKITKAVGIKPKKNLLCLFPSWTEHEVLRNDSDSERISISFNLLVK